MLDLAIVLALVVLNAIGHASYIRWRRNRGTRRALKPAGAAKRALVYPTHPSPGFVELCDNTATVRPIGIDW